MIITPKCGLFLPFENTLIDSVSGANLTMGGGSANYVDGKVGRGIDLNGSSDWIDLGFDTVGGFIDGSSAITVSFWLNADTISLSRQDIFYSKLPSGGTGAIAAVLVSMRDTGTIRYGGRSVQSESGKAITSGIVVNVGVWDFYSMVLDYSGKMGFLYKNGVLVHSATFSFSSDTYQHTNTNGGDIERTDVIGSSAGVGGLMSYTNGKIDSVSLFRTKLNGGDIKRVMHGLHPLNG